MASPCPHGIQLLQVAPNAPRQRQVLSPLHQRVSRPRGQVKPSRGVGSCVRALAQRSYMSLTTRTTAHPARDSLHLIVYSRRANARILLACFFHHLLSRVPGRPYLAHAMVVHLLSCESVALSAPTPVHGIQARALALAAVAFSSLVWVAGLTTTATAGGRNTTFAIDFVTISAV